MSDAFDAALRRVTELGRVAVEPHAAAVDRDARFPFEAFAALREARLLSCYVPEALGGMGLTVREVARLCEVLGASCGSTAMVFAMHQIQVAILVHHGGSAFEEFLRGLVAHQWVMASATTEAGIGGDVRTSTCAVVSDGGRFSLTKVAPVISYGAEADVICVTARAHPDAGPSDQVLVVVPKEECSLEPLNGWDTLGFRGTCSSGYTLRAAGPRARIVPVPYAEVHAKTMHPFAHCVWSSLWLGIASDAVSRARSVVRRQARKAGALPPSAMRLAEVDADLFTFRRVVEGTVQEYEERLERYRGAPFPSDFAFALRVNNLKITASKLLIEVVGQAMSICGIEGYRNDSRDSVARHLRDAYGASLMVHNDRILGQSATMQIAVRE